MHIWSLHLLIPILQNLYVYRLLWFVIFADVHHLGKTEPELEPKPHIPQLLLRHPRFLNIIIMHKKILPIDVHYDKTIILRFIEKLKPPCVSLWGFLNNHRFLLVFSIVLVLIIDVETVFVFWLLILFLL